LKSSKPFFVSSATLALLAFIILARLLTLGMPDFIDTTEGRYATVAKLMLDRDDWVTPYINFKGVVEPYLGKPPLHFWLMDICYLLFGQNNFAGRLPSLLSALGIGASVWFLAAAVLSSEAAILSVFVLASSCLMFFLAGAVVLDVTLTLGITIAICSFYLADRSRLAGYLFFAGLGLGVLVKGPLACVLAGFTIAPWAAVHWLQTKSLPSQLRKLPWVTGIMLFFAIVIPWYWWAEIRNPGFLKYFLWNENFGRYLKSDYGDEYGTGHRQPFGTAWLFMIMGLFPWSVLILVLLGMKWRSVFSKRFIQTLREDSLLLYAFAWTVSCPVLLMAAKQYTGTYIVPSLPGFALLMGVLWERQKTRQWIAHSTLATILRGVLGILGGVLAIGGAIAFRYHSPILAACAAIAIGVYICWAAFSRSRLLDLFAASIRVAAITAITFSFALLCYTDNLSNNRSSRRVLEQASALVPGDKPLRVGFPFGIPFSSNFYAPLMTKRPVSVLLLTEDKIANADVDVMIVRTRDTAALERFTKLGARLGTVGKWSIFRAASAVDVTTP
jgi:4-amino-4-deoxy-L-arabinose transferase-like glycosyltransferase